MKALLSSVLTSCNYSPTRQYGFSRLSWFMHKPQKTTHSASPPPSPAGRGEVILVVDDEPRIRDAVRRALIKQGYQIILAADGVEAVALFTEQQEKIKLILTDIMM